MTNTNGDNHMTTDDTQKNGGTPPAINLDDFRPPVPPQDDTTAFFISAGPKILDLFVTINNDTELRESFAKGDIELLINREGIQSRNPNAGTPFEIPGYL